MMTALGLVPSGIPLHESFGDTSSLSHEYWAGIELPCVNALLVISIATVVSLTYGWGVMASVSFCEHARLTEGCYSHRGCENWDRGAYAEHSSLLWMSVGLVSLHFQGVGLLVTYGSAAGLSTDHWPWAKGASIQSGISGSRTRDSLRKNAIITNTFNRWTAYFS
jgi:hypothetical protein